MVSYAEGKMAPTMTNISVYSLMTVLPVKFWKGCVFIIIIIIIIIIMVWREDES